jgi:hypothetical protein
MNLREAAERTLRSITTLRRYIRSGRLRAEKVRGRYGPEYFVSEDDLRHAGLTLEPIEDEPPRALEKVRTSLPAPRGGETVPLSLYLELQMKHEQLLVQYGMMRASGLRVLDLQGEIETKRGEIEEYRAQVSVLKERLSREAGRTRKRLQEAELELEGRGLEIAALKEKIRGLEMLTRNAVTNESIERQVSDLMDQTRRVERSASRQDKQPPTEGWVRSPTPDPNTDH